MIARSVGPRLMEYCTIASPIGPLLLAGDHEGLRFLLFENDLERFKARRSGLPEPGIPGAVEPRTLGTLEPCVRQLNAYFQGALRAFDVPVAPQGTPFQRSVWAELQKIPYGETISYGELARRLGNPRAVRAVGLANGSNPIAIIIPCHRVIGSNGSLVGYGGGLATKQTLLALERGQRTLL
jgi:methylated-DNA-[protein]-cysteine S-methyltransferase